MEGEQVGDGGQGDILGGLLIDPHHVRADIRMLGHVFSGKGPPPEHIEEIWHRLMGHLRTDAVRQIDPDTGMSFLNDKLGADISIKAAAALGKFVKMFVDDEKFGIEAAIKAKQAENGTGGDTYNIVAGSLHMGQEPLSVDDAKSQAADILERIRQRSSPPKVIEVKAESKGLGDL